MLSVVAVCAACSGSPAPATTLPRSSSTSAAVSPPNAVDASGWGKFHSKRFALTVPLPDGKAWKIDDHRSPELVAVHEPTSSRLQLITTQEDALMNRQRCEERAQRLGWLTNVSRFTTLEDEVHVGPDQYDSRVWVALNPGAPNGRVEGHIFLFGAFLRRCLLVHYTTSVASAKEEEQLASRLASASARLVKGITLDPMRTTDDATVPRDKPPIRR
jgi:hypothetical protein